MRHPAYPAYKESGVQWLGQVPEHWVVKSARFDYAIQLGKMLQPEATSHSDQETPYLKAQHVQWESVRITDLPTMWASLSDRSKYGVCDGDLLVCEGGDVGRSGIVNNPPDATIIQNALHRVRSRNADLRYLLFVLEHAASQSWFEILCNRSTIAHFTGEKFGALQIPTPPTLEQAAIADFLDRETGRIDRLVAKKRRLIELLREKRTALVSRTVTRGLPADAAREFGLEPHIHFKDSGIDWLGEVPEGWEVKLLKFISGIQTGYAFSSDEFTYEGIPVLRIGDITKDGSVDFTNAKYLPEKHENIYSNMLITRGAIVMAMTGATIGKVGKYEYDNPALLNQRVCSFYSTGNNYQNFLWYLLKADFYIEYINLTAFGGAQPNISEKDLLDCIVTVPPLFEQTAIVTYLDRETSMIDRLVEKVEAAVGRLLEYRTALITAAVTGKIDVREVVA